MELRVSDEQALMRGEARELLRRRCAPERLFKLREEGAFDPDLWGEAVRMGWPAAIVPPPEGLGLAFDDACALLEECGRALAPIPLASSLLAGRLLAEAGAGSDVLAELAGGRRVAVMEGLAGDVVRDAAVASEILSVSEAGLTLFEAGAARVDPRLTAGRLREASVRLAESSGRACGALPEPVARLRTLRLLFEAAELSGACDRVLELSVAHVSSRIQFDRPLAAFQSVQHRLADMLTDLDGIRWLLRRTAAELDAGRPAAGLAVRLAIWARESSRRLVASAHQVHGGVGFIRDHPLHMYFGRQKSSELSFGRLADLRDLAAAELLDAGEGN